MENVRLSFEGVEPALFSVRRFHVEEGMSRLFDVRVTAVSADPGVPLDSLVNGAVAFELSGGQGRSWRGVCADAALVRVSEEGAPGLPASGLATYVFRVVPVMFRMTQNRNHRIFQHRSVPSIVASLLDAWGVEARWAVDEGRYPDLELRTQYGESDCHFVSRLLEEAGISFFFEEAGGRSRLVLTDAPQKQEERPLPLPFVEERSLSDLSRGDFVTDLSVRRVSRPGRVTLRDYDPRRPRVIPHVEVRAGDDVETGIDKYRYSPGSFLQEVDKGGLAKLGAASLGAAAGGLQFASTAGATPVADDLGSARHTAAFGALAAETLLEAERAATDALELTCSATDLRPGTVFRVVGHPNEAVSTKPWLSLGQELSGEVARPETWRFRVTGALATRPYRPLPLHEKPRIHGVHTALVVGPGLDASGMPAAAVAAAKAAASGVSAAAAGAAGLADDDIHVDEMGRVRVQFPWDREGKNDPHSYAWTRVSQGWGGAGYGLFTVPRVGHEVLVSFVDGDPDSPIITGRVHNAVQPVPFKLPDNKTVSTFRTQSSPGGAGFNELRFDDAAGREHLLLRAQRDFYETAEVDYLRAIGGAKTAFTRGNETSLVGQDRVAFVGRTDVTASATQINDVADDRHNTVRGEDRNLVGTRWSVTVARGLRSRMPEAFRSSFDRAQGLLVAGFDRALSSLPFDPRADGKLGELIRAARSACEDLSDTLGTKSSFDATGGPTPTHVSVQDRQIVLSTGEASIVLDGPDIHLHARGDIVMHAGELVAHYAGTGILQRAPEAVSHATTGNWVIQSKELHLNPITQGDDDAGAGGGQAGAPAGEPAPGRPDEGVIEQPVFPPLEGDESWVPGLEDDDA